MVQARANGHEGPRRRCARVGHRRSIRDVRAKVDRLAIILQAGEAQQRAAGRAVFELRHVFFAARRNRRRPPRVAGSRGCITRDALQTSRMRASSSVRATTPTRTRRPARTVFDDGGAADECSTERSCDQVAGVRPARGPCALRFLTGCDLVALRLAPRRHRAIAAAASPDHGGQGLRHARGSMARSVSAPVACGRPPTGSRRPTCWRRRSRSSRFRRGGGRSGPEQPSLTERRGFQDRPNGRLLRCGPTCESR